MDSGEPVGVGLARSQRGKRPDAKHFDDLDIVGRPEEKTPKPAPEPKRKVRVIDPFLVSHDRTAHWPNAVAEVPESVAAHWVAQKWVLPLVRGVLHASGVLMVPPPS